MPFGLNFLTVGLSPEEKKILERLEKICETAFELSRLYNCCFLCFETLRRMVWCEGKDSLYSTFLRSESSLCTQQLWFKHIFQVHSNLLLLHFRASRKSQWPQANWECIILLLLWYILKAVFALLNLAVLHFHLFQQVASGHLFSKGGHTARKMIYFSGSVWFSFH